MENVQDKRVSALVAKAEHLHSLLRFASRAFVLEFAGTPKAGKSTAVEAISHFFRRNGFRVHVLHERASFCPIPMKGHVFFNTWCTCTMLAELLENIETETDVIIKDRGLFDSMVWLQLQHRRGEVTDDEVRRIGDFVLLERWRSLVDIVVLCKVSPEQALERESAPRILPKVGSIMNLEVLMGFNEAAEEAEGKYSSFFRKFISKDTTGASPKDTGIELAEQILGTLESFLDPEILVVPREVVQSLPLNSGGRFESSDVGAAIDTMRGAQQYVKRSQAEDSDTLVQLVPCAVLVHSEKIFTFQRKEEDPKYRLYGKTTIWQGCHPDSQSHSVL